MPERFTGSVIAAVRQRYEETDQLIVSIAAEFGVGERTIGRWISAHGWRKRSLRTRGLPVALQLLEEAKKLAASSQEAPPTPTLPFSGRGSSPPPEQASPIDRLEALAVLEIDAEEAAHAQRLGKHSVAKASERSARTLATLTQTLHTLQRMRAGLPAEHESISDDDFARDDITRDDMPADIDEFRRDLARRIDAFVASRTDGDAADGDAASAAVDAAG